MRTSLLALGALLLLAAACDVPPAQLADAASPDAGPPDLGARDQSVEAPLPDLVGPLYEAGLPDGIAWIILPSSATW